MSSCKWVCLCEELLTFCLSVRVFSLYILQSRPCSSGHLETGVCLFMHVSEYVIEPDINTFWIKICI